MPALVLEEFAIICSMNTAASWPTTSRICSTISPRAASWPYARPAMATTARRSGERDRAV
jgi:hypothetical protein